jgi:hypothetical protein
VHYPGYGYEPVHEPYYPPDLVRAAEAILALKIVTSIGLTWDYRLNDYAAIITLPRELYDALQLAPVIEATAEVIVLTLGESVLITAVAAWAVYEAIQRGREEYDERRCKAMDYSGNDPNKAHEGWEPNEKGGRYFRKGPLTGLRETIRPHLEPHRRKSREIPPHWDYNGPGGTTWRKYPDGHCEKTGK